MTVRLLRPYNGQPSNSLYTGADEAVLKATGGADDQVEAAIGYAAYKVSQQGGRIRPAVTSAGIGAGQLQQPTGLRWVPANVSLSSSTSGYSYAGEVTGPAIIWGIVRLFVDPTNATGAASDAAAGTVQAAPLLTYSAARAKTTTAGTEIVIFGHKQDIVLKETATWTAVTVNYRTINREPFRVSLLRVGDVNAPTWAATSGQPGVYETTITAVNANNVIDMANKVDMAVRVQVPVDGTVADQARHQATVRNAPPAWHAPVLVASIAAVAAAPGSRYHDGTKLYVQAIDSRNLVGDLKMLPLANGTYGRSAAGFANVTQWFRGLDWIGGDTPFFLSSGNNTIAGVHIIFENCSFQGGGPAGAGGLAVSAVARVTLIRCAAWFNYHDGFNYHSSGNDPLFGPNVAEIECVAGGNGTTGSVGPSENDSTAHERANVVSQNCVFLGSRDRTVADINFAQRWIIGGYIGAPINSDGVSLANYGTANDVLAYVDGVQFAPAGANAGNIRAEQNAVVQTRNTSNNLQGSFGGNGVIGAY